MANNSKSEDQSEESLKEDKDEPKMSLAEERSEYFKKLEKWLQEAYAWQSVAAMFPYYVMSNQVLNLSEKEILRKKKIITGAMPFGSSIPTTSAQRINTATPPQQNDLQRQRRPQETAPPHFQRADAEGFEFRIPPVWKRLAAEFIDSAMLFLLRISISFVIIDFFDFIGLEDSELLQTNLPIDYKMFIEVTYGTILLEIINRIAVCILEAFWLQRGMNGRIGGTTPGKSIMGLRVVQCRNVVPADRADDPDMVYVQPGTDLGFPLAFSRAVIKTLILSSVFPICFGVFFFRFNRTGYDLICNSIVIEDPYRNVNNNNNNNNNRNRR
ncbi:protein FAM8A1 isoform X1 [Polistes fuscatus]|uniref:protein FAM8A1 isoform X1 n=1 Tax=Polistes fuscatus TaxID=30207 RepID=UPI001CA7F52E|nr:protein FAM8A1 isoform X1 [Polistes fuscatus]XP_043492765.1 protein FAM8A1 isoform X1 [Polistes fuscatus]